MSLPVRSYRTLFWILAFVGLAADLGSKHVVWTRFEPGEEGVVMIEGVFSLIRQPALNRGALFGIGNVHGDTANLVFTIISAGAVLLIVGWTFHRQTARDLLLCAALGLVLSGAMGNLFDRLVYGGVRDFIWFRYRSFNWPVFNIADSCLVCGAGLLLLHAFFVKPPKPDAPAEAAPTANSADARA